MSAYLIPFNFEKFSDSHNVQDTIVTTHAKEEAQRKFGKSHKLAEGWIRANLAHAKYVGDVLDDKGERDTKLYAYKRIAFIVSKEGDTVITIYPRNHVSTEFSEPIRKYIEREIRKANRKVGETERKNSLEKALLKIEVAELEYRLLKTKSESVKYASQARINAIHERKAELDAELLSVKLERSALLKGVAAFV